MKGYSFGPPRQPPRDGDKIQARERIAAEVRQGHIPHPNELACTDCGHIWAEGERRHEYDHHLGYAAEHHEDVEPVCTICHSHRDNAKFNQTHCIRGHPFDDANTGRKPNGTRFCRECHRIFERTKRTRPPGYWTRDARRARAAAKIEKENGDVG